MTDDTKMTETLISDEKLEEATGGVDPETGLGGVICHQCGKHFIGAPCTNCPECCFKNGPSYDL